MQTPSLIELFLYIIENNRIFYNFGCRKHDNRQCVGVSTTPVGWPGGANGQLPPRPLHGIFNKDRIESSNAEQQSFYWRKTSNTGVTPSHKGVGQSASYHAMGSHERMRTDHHLKSMMTHNVQLEYITNLEHWDCYPNEGLFKAGPKPCICNCDPDITPYSESSAWVWFRVNA